MELKDNIDFGKEPIGRLFRKMFVPTLLGMLFMVIFTFTDGIFVGHGLGSDALAAINLVAPLMLVSTGIGLMFGLGASVTASIHLARKNIKTARINVSQATITSVAILTIISIIILIFPEPTLRLLGCPDSLMDECKEYAYGFVPFLAINSLLCSGEFFIRLSGAPKYAMICSLVASVINIILDYLFIFVFKFGLFGAAIATSTGLAIGSIMILIYLLDKRHLLHIIKIKLSRKSLKLSLRNIGYMCRLGFSSLLGELAISATMICGNYIFFKYMSEDGVAAYSIYGYFSPLVFMIYNAIAVSVQPIISFNYGIANRTRIRKALTLALKISLGFGFVLFLLTALFSDTVASMFIDSSSPVHALASKGLPLISLCFIPLAVNVVTVCYMQSIEQDKKANIITLLRGFILMFACFILMPLVFGDNGVWLAVVGSELLTMFMVVPLLRNSKFLRQNS